MPLRNIKSVEQEDSHERLIRKLALVDVVPNLIDLLDALNMAIILSDESGKFLYLNQEALSWWKCSFKQISNFSYLDTMHPTDHEIANRVVEIVKSEPKIVYHDPYFYKHKTLDGSDDFFYGDWYLCWLSDTRIFLTYGHPLKELPGF